MSAFPDTDTRYGEVLAARQVPREQWRNYQTIKVQLRFTPMEMSQFIQTLCIQSNDPDEPEVTLTLKGRGTAPRTP